MWNGKERLHPDCRTERNVHCTRFLLVQLKKKNKKQSVGFIIFLRKTNKEKTQKYSQKEMILALKHVLVNVMDIVIKKDIF